MTDQLPGRTPPWAQGFWISPAHVSPLPPQQEPVRVGDAERDEALDKLGDHFAAGRLTREELDERTEQAMGARFDRDLELLFRDLPASRKAEVVARPRRPRSAMVVPAAVGLLVPLIVLALVASIVLHLPFLIGPVVWMVLLSGAGRRHHLR